MLEQIQEVVRKNLPSEVGDQLKKHLADAEAKSRRLEMLEADLQEHKKRLGDREVRIVDLEAKLKLAGDLDKREKEVAQRENKLSVTLAEKRAEAAELALSKVETLAALAFRSPVFVQKEINSVPIAVPGQSYASSAMETKERKTTQE